MTLKEIFCESIPTLTVGDAATIGYIDAKGDYYYPDLECDVDRAPLDAEFLRRVCLEKTESTRYADVAFPIQLASICGKNDKYI